MLTYGDGWTALGDPTRRVIFERLATQPLAVVDLARELPVSRPAVSQHLKVLKNAGLVLDERSGARRIYRVNHDGLDKMRAELDSFWNDTLTAYKHLVELPDPTSMGANVETAPPSVPSVRAPGGTP